MQRQGYFQQPARLQGDCTRCREEQATSYSLTLTVSFLALKTTARCAELRRPCPAARFWPSLNAKPWGGCGLGHSLFISTHSAGYLVGVALRRTLQQDVQVTSSSQPFRRRALDSPTDRKDSLRNAVEARSRPAASLPADAHWTGWAHRQEGFANLARNAVVESHVLQPGL